MTNDHTTGAAPADARYAGLPGRPGKIIAVHLSYVSRADQRGRRPAAPSWERNWASGTARAKRSCGASTRTA